MEEDEDIRKQFLVNQVRVEESLLDKEEHSPLEFVELEDISNEKQANVFDKEVVDLSLLESLSGKKKPNFFQRRFTPRFLSNLQIVMRVFVATVLSSVLVFIGKVSSNIVYPQYTVIIAVVLVRMTYGGTFRGIFYMTGCLSGVLFAYVKKIIFSVFFH